MQEKSVLADNYGWVNVFIIVWKNRENKLNQKIPKNDAREMKQGTVDVQRCCSRKRLR
jgi:hypothetical protein